MSKKLNPPNAADFFAAPTSDPESGQLIAERMIAQAQALPPGVKLLIGASPLALAVAEASAEEVSTLIPRERWRIAAAVAELMHRLGGEVKKRDFLLDELVDELARLPAFVEKADEAWASLVELVRRGLPLDGVPVDASATAQSLLPLSQRVHIALEYLLGNLQKLARLLQRLGVRDETINASALYHNYLSGFAELEPGPAAPAEVLIAMAVKLRDQGCAVQVFRQGNFKRPLADLNAAELDALAEETGGNYGVAASEFLGFLEALLARELGRLEATPKLDLVSLIAAFKFNEGERELLSHPAVVRGDDPTRWQETALGRALVALRPDLNWLVVSAGMKAAGELDAAAAQSLAPALAALRGAAEGYTVTIESGREGRRAEHRLSELGDQDLLFDLYCQALLERRPLRLVVETAAEVLKLIRALENPEPLIRLSEVLGARLRGEALSGILSTQGLVLRNFSLAEGLSKLRALADKVRFSVPGPQGQPLALESASLEDFRRAVLLMGRRQRADSSPSRVLALIRDKIVPEIKGLPKAVIAPGAHDLARVVELAGAGVPARYPLRRKWTRVNLDPLASMGSGLEPGIRNCLGCPVNALYGLVNKTAVAAGFEEIITYEATGCFEVYSGIWPYTGKKNPSLHGVFGGAPSELLGGLAAKKARLKHAHKLKNAEGEALRLGLKRTLHLGWGGDGATFDIGFGNLSGLFARLQKLAQDPLDLELDQRALYVCYDNEGYQNTGNQYSAASAPGGHTTTNPQGQQKPMGNDLRKKPIVEIMAGHGASVAARLNLHRQEHIMRVVARALEDGINGAFLHFLQPCTTGWKFTADSLTYDLAYLSEEGGLFAPVTFEHGVPYLEMYPTPRNPGDSFLKLQARFKHLLGGGTIEKKQVQRVMDYYAAEWRRNVHLGGFEDEIPYADRLAYLEEEHRKPRVSV
ncbi:MAG: hypothetical protein HYZ17_08015 [Betaproteobacteria bacterium]|nr:hypothetical protein [Betaproteobacteria bacterium]